MNSIVKYVEQLIRKESAESEILDLFKVFDVDRNGSVSREELKHGLNGLSKELIEADVQKTIKECADVHGQVALPRLIFYLASQENRDVIQNCFKIFGQQGEGGEVQRVYDTLKEEMNGIQFNLLMKEAYKGLIPLLCLMFASTTDE